jgi:pimeloyl-ACP methyl ester carboxylesterase
MEVKPFRIHVPEETLADLRDRLARTRWPDEVAGAGWDYGIPLAYLRDVAAYWRDGFDWRAQERAINGFAHFRAEVEGVGIHFIHERGKGPDPLPLILTHGWPSSFYELYKLIPLLTDPASYGGDPADAFTVVVPSIPGHGFSDRPAERGFDFRRVATLWARLMEGLGYARFGAHGYDVGASVSAYLGLDHADHLIGYHTTYPGALVPEPDLADPATTEAERAYVALVREWVREEGGYGHIQGTRPQTLAYGLNDSPAGLAAWILEKWRAWTNPPDDVEAYFTRDELLTNVTIYWATQTINSSTRFYYEGRHHMRRPAPGERVTVPVGVALVATQPNERPPREYVERLYPDIRHWVELGRGGHFVMLEEPALVAESLRAFFRPLRSSNNASP